jgi:hypothetical protein
VSAATRPCPQFRCMCAHATPLCKVPQVSDPCRSGARASPAQGPVGWGRVAHLHCCPFGTEQLRIVHRVLRQATAVDYCPAAIGPWGFRRAQVASGLDVQTPAGTTRRFRNRLMAALLCHALSNTSFHIGTPDVCYLQHRTARLPHCVAVAGRAFRTAEQAPRGAGMRSRELVVLVVQLPFGRGTLTKACAVVVYLG